MYKWIAAFGLSLAITSTLWGQTVYRVRDLGAIGTPPPPIGLVGTSVHLPYRINDEGHVIYNVHNGSMLQPYLFLRFEDSSFPLSPGYYNLSTIAELSLGQAIATDINENDQISGAKGTAGSRDAIVWTLDGEDGEDTFITIVDFSGTSFDGSDGIAHSLNNLDPPIVTGFRTMTEDNCGLPPHVKLPKPFQTELGDTPVELSLDSGYYWGHGLSINDNETVIGIEQANCEPAPGCQNGTEPLRWLSPTTPNEVDSFDTGLGSQPIKINETGNICGWSRQDDEEDCWITAAYWASESSSIVALGDFTGFGSDDETIAYGMNETSPLSVVGTSLTGNFAIRWDQESNGSWDNDWVNLNNVLVDDCDSVWTLFAAFDINDSGYIVGYGYVNETPHAYLLIPGEPCKADLGQAAGLCPDGKVIRPTSSYS